MTGIYYTKKEYDEMIKKYERKIKSLESQNTKLTKKLQEVKADYDALLETATEEA
jgi:prefoldin subunit 5